MNDSTAYGQRALFAEFVLTLVVGGACLAGVLTLDPNPLRTTLAVVFLLTLPGYALSTLLFPGRGENKLPADDLSVTFASRNDPSCAGLPFGQRIAVSFGLSIALVPVLALLLDVVGIPFDVVPIAALTGGFAVVALVLGVVRRYRIAPEHRYVLPWFYLDKLGLWMRSGDQTTRALNLALVVAVVLATASVGVALVAPPGDREYTQVSVLTERNGELVAGGYPNQTTVGEANELVLEVQNREGEQTTYSVVVELQQVNDDGNVVKSAEVNRFSKAVGNDETWTAPHEVTPPFAGKDLRVVYLVYRGDPPSDPDIESSYRHLTVWTNVTRG